MADSVMTEEEWSELAGIVGGFWHEALSRTGQDGSFADDAGRLVVAVAGVLAFTLIVEARQGHPPTEEKKEALRSICYEAIDHTMTKLDATIEQERGERMVAELLSSITKGAEHE